MEHFPVSDRMVRPALLKTAQRSIVVPLVGAILGATIVAVVTGLIVSWLSMDHLPAWPALAVVAALASGSGAALLAGGLISRSIAASFVMPIGLLLDQLDSADCDGFNWRRGGALSRAEMSADMKLLKRRIREVTRHSARVLADLDHARDEACRQNLAKSQFLANMSHELRTPLNAILGYAMILHEDASEEANMSVVADLDRIQQAGRNLLGLINDVLDLAKIETGRTSIDRIAFDVPGLVHAAAESCGAGDPPNGNQFQTAIDDRIGIMVGDAGKLRQCLSNLLSNAFKFTRDGQVTLTVSIQDRAGASWIEFAVRDTGIGIRLDDIESIFDPFQQAKGRAARTFGGSGVGLALARRLVRMMGGDCTVESIPERGSTFRLTLPMGEQAHVQQSNVPSAHVATSTFVATANAKHTALVVDDDEAAVDLMQRWLLRMGFSVLTTTSADAALELVREHKPDFVLLDALLPYRSGYDVLEELRGDPAIRHIPTILITVDDDRARGLKAGATEYLHKPITEDQLRQVLDLYRTPATGDILVIDDDDDAADLLVRSVAQIGFTARRAVDGRQGLAMANAIRPDAIVLDLVMPNLGGFEVLDRLSASSRLREVPLIVVSGCDLSISEHRKLAAAGHQFFAKAASTPRQIAQSLKEMVA